MKHYDLIVASDMSETIGLLHSMVVYNFERLKRQVDGLNQEEIDYKGQNNEYNSIAQLLRHLTVVDLHWIFRLQGLNYSIDMLHRFGPMYDSQGKLPFVKDISLETLMSEYEEIQKKLKEVCFQITEEQINDIVPFENGNTSTIKWGIWHIADHSRHHYANIVQMKKLYRINKVDDEDSMMMIQ